MNLSSCSRAQRLASSPAHCPKFLSASGPTNELHSPVIVMAALHIILHSFTSHMHIFCAAFPLTRALQRPCSFLFLLPGIFLFSS